MTVSLPLKSKLELFAAKQTLYDLDQAGFVLSIGKCMLEPVQKGKWLGVILNLGSEPCSEPEDKITTCQSCVSKLNISSRVHVQTLFSIVVQIRSMGPCY